MQLSVVFKDKAGIAARCAMAFAAAQFGYCAAHADDTSSEDSTLPQISAQGFLDNYTALDQEQALFASVGSLDLEWAAPIRDPRDELTFVGRDVLGTDTFNILYSHAEQADWGLASRSGGVQALFAPWGEGPQYPRDTYTFASVSFNTAGQWRSASNLGRFNLDVTPRANVELGSAGQSVAGAGALVRFGEGLMTNGGGMGDGAWFLFVGADAQALTWRPRSSYVLSDGGMAIQDMVIMGDIQAGIAWRYGRADVALAYVHRDYSAGVQTNLTDMSHREREDFVGLSIAWVY